MTSAATDILKWKHLPLPVRHCHKFDDATITEPLISVPQLAINGYSTLMTPYNATIYDGSWKPVLHGNFNRLRRTYTIPLEQHAMTARDYTTRGGLPKAHLAYQSRDVPALIQFHHASAGYPTTGAWTTAVKKGYYVGWPGLTAERITKYLAKSIHTTMGHQQLIRQHVRSTKTTHGPRSRLHSISVHIEDHNVCDKPELSNRIASDQTGRYPITSGRGHKYILVLYDIDANYIHGIPIKSRKAEEILRGFKAAYQVLLDNNFKARDLRCDNEISKIFTEYLTNDAQLEYQLVPPHNHRTNPAEVAIRDYKHHFIATRSGADDNFPKDSWDLLLPLVNITVNLVRASHLQPRLSAYAQIHGNYDYNRYPLAPAGCKVVVYETPNQRPTFNNHGIVGYYIGPSNQHYRNHVCYIPEHRSTRYSDTVAFFPNFPLPGPNRIEQLSDLVTDIRGLLRGTQHPVPTPTDTPTGAITHLRDLFRLQDEDDTAPRVVTKNQLIKTTKPVPSPRVSRRNRIHDAGTIVRKRFQEDQRIQEGEVIEYDQLNQLYKIRYLDNTTDDYTKDEMKTHYKPEQKYSHAKYKGRALSVYQIASQLGLTVLDNPQQRNQWMQESTFENEVRHSAQAAGGTIWDEQLNRMAHYRDLIKHPDPKIRGRWTTAGENEFGRLCQGFKPNEITGMDVIEWIAHHTVPRNKKVTYARFTVAYRPEKDEPYRCRITAGGDQLDYHGNVTTTVSSMESFKLLLNSTISTNGAKLFTGDISNMYLESNLDDPEYVRFKLESIPRRIMDYYNLWLLAHNGYVYAKINKAWYGLKQSGKIAHDDLVNHLAKAGYIKAKTEGLFIHKTNKNIAFTLVVDDFACKYDNLQDAEHLIAHIQKKYKFKVDWEAQQYIGINLKWDYANRTVELSMEDYVKQALQELQHPKPKRHQYAPSRMERPEYGQPIQYVNTDESAALTPDEIKYKQRAVGKFLFYARAIDNTMLHSLNDIAISKHTQNSMEAVRHFLDYAASNPNAKIKYRASDMVIQSDSDAAYLVCPEARSRAGGYTFVGDKNNVSFNGPITVLAKVIKHVMSSVAEAEIIAVYMLAQDMIPLRLCLEELGHKQPPTPIKTDNSTAVGIGNNTTKQKRSKSMDMRIHWMRDRIKQKQFDLYWKPGLENLADYPTKHHSGRHHKKVRPIYLYEGEKSPVTVQGCIELMSEAHGKPPRPTRTSNAYSTQLTCEAHKVRKRAHEVHKRVTWWDQPKSYMVGTKTKTKTYMAGPTKTKSSMTSKASTMEIQQQGSKPSNYTVMSSRNGIREILNRLSFLV